jgi:hypothetical protein
VQQVTIALLAVLGCIPFLEGCASIVLLGIFPQPGAVIAQHVVRECLRILEAHVIIVPMGIHQLLVVVVRLAPQASIQCQTALV